MRRERVPLSVQTLDNNTHLGQISYLKAATIFDQRASSDLHPTIMRVLIPLVVLFGLLLGFLSVWIWLDAFPARQSSPVALSVSDTECARRTRLRVPLKRPLKEDTGYAFVAEVNFAVGDGVEAPTRSMVVTCEDGIILGPAHSSHEDIRKIGKGRFSHWGATLYFSTSDNTDPNLNKRAYEVGTLQPAH